MTVEERTDGGAADTADTTPQERAVRQREKRRDFRAHLLAFASVNSVIVVVWLATTPKGFFWPAFPMLVWGIAVV